MSYQDFISSKALAQIATGFDPQKLGPHLFDFQAAIVEWACKRGRAAIFADTGRGKSRRRSRSEARNTPCPLNLFAM